MLGIDNYFGIPIYKIKPDFGKSREQLLQYLRNERQTSSITNNYVNGYSNTGWHSVQWDSSNSPGLVNDVINEFKASFEEFFDELLKVNCPTKQFTLETAEIDFVAWAVINQMHDYNLRHIHSSASRDTWAVVYYVDIPKDAQGGEIRFYNPCLAYRCSIGTTLHKLGAKTMYMNIAPETGMLLIFPGWLEHEVLPMRSGGDRVVFAANLSIKKIEVRCNETGRLLAPL